MACPSGHAIIKFINSQFVKVISTIVEINSANIHIIYIYI